MNEETLFAEALALPVEQRWEYLARSCSGNPELLAAVVSLLAAHDRSQHPLDRSPAELVASEGTSAQPTNDLPASAETTRVIAGRYSLLERIGEGGMGEVWVAKQTEPVRRKVAIKLIKAGMDSKAVLSRFERERQALALMDHPHIARVFDGGMTEDRRPYFVMELVNGLPLNRFCDEVRLGIRERLELFIPICHAVQHAHQKGIIHRDLKPSNVLVTIIDGKPVPKVIDFGVAKAASGRLTDETMSTQFGAVVGTLEYMSPEQAGYAGEDIDTRSDIYSLGVILYELLTGLRPLDAGRLKQAMLSEMMRIIREEEPAKPSTRISTDQSLPSLAAVRRTEPKRLMSLLRGELDWVVMKCLEKQRDRRYETAGALSRDIERYLTDQPVEARPPSWGYRLRKFVHRHQIRVIAASLLGVTVAALAGTALIGRLYALADQERLFAAEAARLAQQNERLAVDSRSYAEAATYEALVSREQVRQVLYAADMQVVWNHWQSNRPQAMTELLQRHVPEAGANDHRGFEWHYLWRLANSAQHVLRGHSQPISTLAFAGNGAALLSGDVEYRYAQPGTLRRWNLESKETANALFTQAVSTQRADYFPGIRSLSASPDGTRCALVDDTVVRVLDVQTGRERLRLQPEQSEPWSVAFAPDGQHLAIGTRDGQITLWELAHGEQVREIGKHELAIIQLAFSPDGQQLAAGGGDPSAPTWSQLLQGELQLWDVATGRQLGKCDAVRSQLLGLSFHPQGTTIAAATLEGTVVLWDQKQLDGGRILRGHTGPVNAVCWLPDGRYLASAGRDGVVRLWDVGREQGSRVYKGHDGPVTALAASADGKWLAAGGADATVRVWDPQVDPSRTLISDIPWAIGTVAYSDDSRWLAIGTYQQVTICDTQQFQKKKVLPIDHWLFGMAIAPNGSLVATTGNQGEDGEEPGIIKVWDVATATALHTLQPELTSGKTVAFARDGRTLIVQGQVGKRESRGAAIEAWDVARGTLLWHQADASTFAFSPDGRMVALGGTGGVWLVPLEDGSRPGVPLRSRGCLDVQFTPDGKRLALLDAERKLVLWSLADGKEKELGPARHSVVISADGRRIAACDESEIPIWDAISGERLATIPCAEPHLRFTADGRTLVTAGREIRLWHTETGRELLSLGTYETSGVNSLAVSPDGRQIAVGGGYRDEHDGVWVWGK